MEVQERLDVRKRVQQAIAFYEKEGKKATLIEIDDPSGRFIKDDRYIYARDPQGAMLAHPIEKQLVGRCVWELRDSVGKHFIRKILETAGARGYGFSEYIWPAPGNRTDRLKTVFFERVDGMVLCCGFYHTPETSYASLFERLFGPLE